jgi:hypothetical protein
MMTMMMIMMMMMIVSMVTSDPLSALPSNNISGNYTLSIQRGLRLQYDT